MELIYLDHIEWYLGERVVWQFGIDQPVPDSIAQQRKGYAQWLTRQ